MAIDHEATQARCATLLAEERRLRRAAKPLRDALHKCERRIFAMEDERLALERKLKAVRVLEPTPTPHASRKRPEATPPTPAQSMKALAGQLGKEKLRRMLEQMLAEEED